MGYFRVKSKKTLHEMQIGEKLPESDFACVSGDQFVQLEYVEESTKSEPYKVKPGIWTIKKGGGRLVLQETEFNNDQILETFAKTAQLTELIDKFKNRLHVYAKRKIDVPKRVYLLYGPAGTGKSEALKLISLKYAKEGSTAIIFWKTDVIDPYEVKEFVKTFDYKGVKFLIVIAEDIGGVEVDQVRIKSESSLLSLLDNQEKAFRIPTLIIPTTNYPENLLENIANRPKRVDRKIKFDYPTPKERQQLLKFYDTDNVATEEILEQIAQKKYNSFTPAHISEIFLRSDLEDISIKESIDSIQEEIDYFNQLFQNKIKLGIAVKNEYDD